MQFSIERNDLQQSFSTKRYLWICHQETILFLVVTGFFSLRSSDIRCRATARLGMKMGLLQAKNDATMATEFMQ